MYVTTYIGSTKATSSRINMRKIVVASVFGKAEVRPAT